MKSNSLKILIFLCFLIPFNFIEVDCQVNGIGGYSFKISPGALAYYGDMSTNDFNIFTKLANESKFGISALVIKQFRPYFAAQAQFFTGSLYCTASNNTYFAGSLSELSLSVRLDPLRLIKRRSQKLSPYLSAGVGAFGFRSVRRQVGTNLVLLPDFGYKEDGLTKSGINTAMSLPLAIGLSYQVLPFLQLELEHALRMTNTDLLDCLKGSVNINDMFSQTSIGLRFSIPGKAVVKTDPTVPQLTVPLQPITTAKDTVKAVLPEFNLFIDCKIPDTITAGQIIEVKLRINKGKYSGPAKLTQNLPLGFTGVHDLTKSTAFAFTNQNVIIDWDKMPNDQIITYNYEMKIMEDQSGSQVISGRLDYQELSNSKTVNFNKTVFIDNQKLLTEKVAVAEPGKTISSKGNIKPAQPKTGIEFRVQCGAFRENNKADEQLASKHNVTELIQEEVIDGWYKYTVGSFRTYDEAVKYRDLFISRTGILSAFIVAYNDGQRLAKITDAFK